MAAAKVLNAHHIRTHLVEKNSDFGGHAAQWACMATDQCNHCSACLSLEMVDQLNDMAHVSLYPDSQVTGIRRQNDGFRTIIQGPKQTQVDASDIILSTGFTPAMPPGLMKDRWTDSDRIITTEQLNIHLRDQTLDTILSAPNAPLKIGFIQCVGSRNRELGKDYCSQVCCQISMRHINKLLDIYAQPEISLFYIDLQTIGKQARSFFKEVSDQVNLIQGVPFEVFTDRDSGKISVISEDPKTGHRVLSHFNLLVLSVGLHQNRDIRKISDFTDVVPDRFGFLSTPSNGTDTRIWSAGTIEGPMDIQKAIHHGVHTANKVVESLKLNHKLRGTIAMIGDSDAALHLAEQLQIQGLNAFVLGFNGKSVSQKLFEHFNDVELHRVTGTAGQFEILFKADHKTYKKGADAIVVSPELMKVDLATGFDIPNHRVCSFDKFLELSGDDEFDQPSTIVFWLDYGGPQDKSSARKVLTKAISLARQGKIVTILMANMLVHGLDGQKMYDTARLLGIRFLRPEDPSEVQIESNEDGLNLVLKERTLGNLKLNLPCDCLVIPEKKMPHEHFSQIASALRVSLDSEGLLQSANVRHQWVKGPQNGIFYLGECRGECDTADLQIQTDLISSFIETIGTNPEPDAMCDITIDRTACKKCLTCYRTCPHGAVVLEDQTPLIVPESCFNCGLCIASCPALAIKSNPFADDKLMANIDQEKKIVVFACERSGALAANGVDLKDDIQVLTVPCVCRISRNIILKAIERNKKIILAGCHDQNCRSIKGSLKAESRVSWFSRLPGSIKEQVYWFPVAANESKRFELFLTENGFKQNAIRKKDSVSHAALN